MEAFHHGFHCQIFFLLFLFVLLQYFFILMKSADQFIKNSSRNIIVMKKNNRKKTLSKQQNHNKKYLLEGQTKEIGNLVVQRNTTNNTKVITFQFVNHNQTTQIHPSNIFSKFMNQQPAKSKPYNHKELYVQTMRPAKKWHLNNYQIEFSELKRLENQLCRQKNSFVQNGIHNEDDFQQFKLEVHGINKNTANYYSESEGIPRMSTSSERRSTQKSFKVRVNSGIVTTRTKSYQLNNNNQDQVAELMRRPTIRKGHFVFGLSEKVQPVQNKMQIFRDFLWKINYSNRFIVIAPVDLVQPYKLFMGKGNNSLMVQGILKRRSWWVLTDKEEDSNFAWTQLKLNNFLKLQSSNQKQRSKRQIYGSFVLKRQKRQTDDSSLIKDQKPKIQQEPSKTIIDQLNRETQNVPNLEDPHKKIFNKNDYQNWKEHTKRNYKYQEKTHTNTFKKRLNFFNKKKLMKIQNPSTLKMHNHLLENYYIGNKKALFYNLQKYYEFRQENVFDHVPLTFHIIKGIEDPKYLSFVKKYDELQKTKAKNKEFKNIWIMKPGQNTNRGNGISVCFSLDDIKYRLRMKQKNKDGALRTFILQKYIQKPLLYKNRKFDLRHYMIVTCFGGSIKAYWYEHGYVRTSSSAYSLRNRKDLFVHLTNDAIQKFGQDYGKYENGNKISYEQLQKYIRKKCKKQLRQKQVSFVEQILPKMKKIANDSVKATFHLLDKERRYNNFELLGLDFMIDQNYEPCLIEVNTNPCLELSCPILEHLIPQLIDNVFKICIDPFFPPPENIPQNKKQFYNFEDPLSENKFQLIFDEVIDGQQLKDLFEDRQKMNAQLGNIQEDDEQFDNDGVEEWQQKKKQKINQ